MPYAIDTHCHLHLMPAERREEVVRRAREAGVKKLVNVACTLTEADQCLALTKQYDFIWTTAGIHPTELSGDIKGDLDKVRALAEREERVVAIGEMGLDYYHDKFPRELQIAYLEGHLRIAQDLNLPAVIHTRAGKYAGENESAYRDMIEALKAEGFTNGVMHCFSGAKQEARELLELGMSLSFTGIITYDRNQELRDIIKEMPWNRLMIETDSPFLTPQRYRGQKNEPAYLMEVADTVARVRGVRIEEVLEKTSANAERLFGI